ncbi:hypothetical protein JHK82_012838 [Glycine max]|nr:hypothetical protein GLYMA_05G132300v4 [Glycine max]KAG5029245.1 hypothetical protein JHK87_012759 [Glycine soja]KAG5040722.1 hypothetical protein JHK85_013198 [Glycine max]KAG5057860.1 hypothetical protein JHK86_012856 [Glycine max]KAG5154869.1 hypothetical protein JHK82_012838 [Glycine max]
MNCSEAASGGDMSVKPAAWLERLMAETFFGGCGVHQNHKKNEKNVFCLHCCLSICPHCLPSHRSHSLLQVRRYVYHDVVRLGDLENLVDCSNIQLEGQIRVDCYTQFVPTSSCSNTEATSSSIANNNNNKTNGFFLSLGSRRKGAPHRAPLS